jgi:hypothetical protein
MTGAITLLLTGNWKGGYYFMSLMTGHRLIHHHWTSLPMPKDVINRVNTLGRLSLAAQDLSFTWHDGTPILDPDDDDDAYNSNYVPSEIANESDDDLLAAGVDDDNENPDEDKEDEDDNKGDGDSDNNNEPDNESNEDGDAGDVDDDDSAPEGDNSDDNEGSVSDAPIISNDDGEPEALEPNGNTGVAAEINKPEIEPVSTTGVPEETAQNGDEIPGVTGGSTEKRMLVQITMKVSKMTMILRPLWTDGMGSMYMSIICIHANPKTTVTGMLILNILPSPITM